MPRENAPEQLTPQEIPNNKPEKTKDADPEKYYDQVRQDYGAVAADIERVYNQINRRQYLYALKAGDDLQELYFEIVDVIDARPEDIPAYTEPILRALGDAAREGKWQTYDHVVHNRIRDKLAKYGVPLKKR